MSQAGYYLQSGVTPSGFVETLTGDTGGAVGPTSGNINVIAGLSTRNSGSTVSIIGNPATSTLTLNLEDANNNMMVGYQSGNASITGRQNSAFGVQTGSALTTGSDNVLVGYQAGTALTGGSGIAATYNTFVGAFAGYQATTAYNNTGLGYTVFQNLTTGSNNIAIGINSAQNTTSATSNISIGTAAGAAITTGSSNIVIGGSAVSNASGIGSVIAIGTNAGSGWTSNESVNICIGNGGISGDTGVLRIGATSGGAGNYVMTSAYIAGIYGNTPSSAQYVTVNSSGQLGSTAAAPSSTSYSIVGAPGYFGTGASTAGAATYGLYNGTNGANSAIPRAGTFSNLYVDVGSNESTTSVTCTLYINGAPTALVATIPALTIGLFSDTTHSVAVNAGDQMYWQFSQSTTGRTGYCTITMLYAC